MLVLRVMTLTEALQPAAPRPTGGRIVRHGIMFVDPIDYYAAPVGTCHYCGGELLLTRKDVRFCKDACRQAEGKRRRNAARK